MSNKWREIMNRLMDCIKKDRLTSFIVLTAFVLYMIAVVPSGSYYCIKSVCGIYFWGAHEHDALWHLALIEHAFQTWPLSLPIFAGHVLTGYNFLLDSAIYLLTLLGISSSGLYFKVQPVIWFAVFVYLLSRLIRSYHYDRFFTRWVFFLVFFSTSFGVIIRIMKHGTVFGSVGVPTMQGALGMTNPQFMWSLCVLLAILVLMRGHVRTWWAVGVLLFLGLGLKFYFIVPALVCISWYGVLAFIQKQYRAVFVLSVSVIIGILLAFGVFYYGASEGGLIWKPLELVHQMVEDKDLWYDQVMVQERYFITQLGHYLSPRLWWIEARTIFLFLFFNFGIRLLGTLGMVVLVIVRLKRHIHALPILLAVFASTLIPILFVQKGVWWNSVQFLYYAIFLASILTAEFFWQITQSLSRTITIGMVIVLVILFVPTNIETAQMFARYDNASYIPEAEVSALAYLRTLPQGVVVADAFIRKDGSILPDLYDTAYISAYSGKQMYIANETQLGLLQIPYAGRLALLKEDPCAVASRVKYVYIRNTRASVLQPCMNKALYSRIFSNSAVDIWQNDDNHAIR